MKRKERCDAQRVTADDAQVEKFATKAESRSSSGNKEREMRTEKESRTEKKSRTAKRKKGWLTQAG